MLVDGCNIHGVGNWKAILGDPKFAFDAGRTAVDLKDRFRTYFPDAYRQHYPNAKTHLSDKIRSTLPNGGSIFEKTRTKRRRPFSQEEDDALRRGYEKHGTLWAQIAQDPIFQAQQRRSTDLRDRFRNAFPDLYEAAGYKPRTPSKKSLSTAHSARSVDGTSKPDHVRSRAARRRLTYPGMIHCGSVTPASDSVDYSSAEEDLPRASSASASLPRRTRRDATFPAAVPRAVSHDVDALQATPCRTTSPLPDQDSRSLSSQSHLLSGPASPSSPRHNLAFPDLTSPEETAFKSAWNQMDWLSADSNLQTSHAPLTASSLFTANMFGSFSAGPHHDVLDRYDLYSSPLSSTANTFGDYVSEMGPGGSFSEADMDLNAFGGPASSMGFTHHSQVAGDLIFASHHGGVLQHGHGFGLYDQNRALYTGVPSTDPVAQSADSGLGLTNLSFPPDGTINEPHTPFDPHGLHSMLNAEDVPLAMLGQPNRDMGPISEVFTPPNLTVSPAELTRASSAPQIETSSGSSAVLHHPPLSRPLTGRPSPSHFSQAAAMGAAQPTVGTPPVQLPIRRLSPHAHLRSASQPPTEHRFVDTRRAAFQTASDAALPTSTRDDSMHDLNHRGTDLYPLPFLDLHYYHVSDVHAPSGHVRDSDR